MGKGGDDQRFKEYLAALDGIKLEAQILEAGKNVAGGILSKLKTKLQTGYSKNILSKKIEELLKDNWLDAEEEAKKALEKEVSAALEEYEGVIGETAEVKQDPKNKKRVKVGRLEGNEGFVKAGAALQSMLKSRPASPGARTVPRPKAAPPTVPTPNPASSTDKEPTVKNTVIAEKMSERPKRGGDVSMKQVSAAGRVDLVQGLEKRRTGIIEDEKEDFDKEVVNTAINDAIEKSKGKIELDALTTIIEGKFDNPEEEVIDGTEFTEIADYVDHVMPKFVKGYQDRVQQEALGRSMGETPPESRSPDQAQAKGETKTAGAPKVDTPTKVTPTKEGLERAMGTYQKAIGYGTPSGAIEHRIQKEGYADYLTVDTDSKGVKYTEKGKAITGITSPEKAVGASKDPKVSTPTAAAKSPPAPAPASPASDDPLKKYKRLLQLGLGMEQVRLKMSAEGAEINGQKVTTSFEIDELKEALSVNKAPATPGVGAQLADKILPRAPAKPPTEEKVAEEVSTTLEAPEVKDAPKSRPIYSGPKLGDKGYVLEEFEMGTILQAMIKKEGLSRDVIALDTYRSDKSDLKDYNEKLSKLKDAGLKDKTVIMPLLYPSSSGMQGVGHWVSIVAKFDKEGSVEVDYLDSWPGGFNGENPKPLQFLKKTFGADKVKTPKHFIQQDAWSCGYFACANSLAVAKGEKVEALGNADAVKYNSSRPPLTEEYKEAHDMFGTSLAEYMKKTEEAQRVLKDVIRESKLEVGGFIKAINTFETAYQRLSYTAEEREESKQAIHFLRGTLPGDNNKKKVDEYIKAVEGLRKDFIIGEVKKAEERVVAPDTPPIAATAKSTPAATTTPPIAATTTPAPAAGATTPPEAEAQGREYNKVVETATKDDLREIEKVSQKSLWQRLKEWGKGLFKTDKGKKAVSGEAASASPPQAVMNPIQPVVMNAEQRDLPAKPVQVESSKSLDQFLDKNCGKTLENEAQVAKEAADIISSIPKDQKRECPNFPQKDGKYDIGAFIKQNNLKNAIIMLPRMKDGKVAMSDNGKPLMDIVKIKDGEVVTGKSMVFSTKVAGESMVPDSVKKVGRAKDVRGSFSASHASTHTHTPTHTPPTRTPPTHGGARDGGVSVG